MRASIEKHLGRGSVIIASVASWFVSFVVHFPDTSWTIYSDVVSFWYREPHLAAGRIPCIEYNFEYPPLACYLTYVSRILGGGSITGYYLAFSGLSLPAYIWIALSARRVAEMYGRAWIATFLALSPSLITYGIYNYDHFFASLLITSTFFYISGRRVLAGALLGLSVGMKLLGILLLPVYLMMIRRRESIEVFFSFASTSLLTFAPVLVLNPSWLPYFVGYHSSWVLENAWFVWIFGDPHSQSAKVFSFMLAGYLLAKTYLNYTGDVIRHSFLVIAAFLLSSYVFTPQMVIWLVPFVATLPLRPHFYVYPVVEVSNVLIILTWFGNYDPLLPGSPPQIFALIRAAALAHLFLSSYRSPRV